jgi:hypothetical protein
MTGVPQIFPASGQPTIPASRFSPRQKRLRTACFREYGKRLTGVVEGARTVNFRPLPGWRESSGASLSPPSLPRLSHCVRVPRTGTGSKKPAERTK